MNFKYNIDSQNVVFTLHFALNLLEIASKQQFLMIPINQILQKIYLLHLSPKKLVN
jgi:hypothetical protein